MRLTVACLLGVIMGSSHAATYTVTNLNDSGAGSLRDAVAQANANAGPDTIIFSVTGTIPLTSGQVWITEALTITGPGAANLTIDAGDSSRVFVIAATSPSCPALDGPDYLVTLSGLRIVKAFNGGGNTGGAIYTEHSLTIDGVIIEGGEAAYGGAIGMQTQYTQQSLTILNSRLTNNTAKPRPGLSINAFGGAVSVFEKCANTKTTPVPITITNSEVSGNRAVPTLAFGNGGGLGFDGFTDVSITNSRIIDNKVVVPASPLPNTVYSGGGMWARSRLLTITQSEFSGNAVTGTGDTTRGGAMWMGNTVNAESMIAYMVNSTISGNASDAGTAGGILVNGAIILEIYNSTIADNQAAPTRTGGIVLTGPAPGKPVPAFKIASSILANNSTADFATNINVLPSFTLDATDTILGTICGTCNITVAGTGNVVGVDPVLGPLAFNGGPTRTQALLSGSPAIDAGSNPLNRTTDQRGPGFPRTNGGKTDAGAYEAAAVPPPPFNNQPIPAVSEYSLALLSLLLAGFGLLALRRR